MTHPLPPWNKSNLTNFVQTVSFKTWKKNTFNIFLKTDLGNHITVDISSTYLTLEILDLLWDLWTKKKDLIALNNNMSFYQTITRINQIKLLTNKIMNNIIIIHHLWKWMSRLYQRYFLYKKHQYLAILEHSPKQET